MVGTINPVEIESEELAQLRAIESEAIHIIREVVAEFDRPALLFSGGKDSIVLLHLAKLAVHPARLPFPIVHIDTGHNFPEVVELRDRVVKQSGLDLVIGSVEEAIAQGKISASRDPGGSRNRLQTPVLLETIRSNGFDAVFGGARRDEERSRAKERVYSVRDEFGQWDPKNQRPEVWNHYNGFINPGQHIRVFPLSNWTELDIWRYIAHNRLELPSVYYAHERQVFLRDGFYMPSSEFLLQKQDEKTETHSVRFRTVGDMTCTAAIPSIADTPDKIVEETIATRTSERGASRADDKVSDAAMEDRKREGYF